MTNTFAKWLKAFMEKQGLTQQVLGEKVGVSHVAISKWQRGLNLPEPRPLRNLSEIAGTHPVVLFQLCGYLPVMLPKPLKSAPRPQMLYVLTLLEDLDDAALDLIAAQVRAVKAYAKLTG